MQYFIEVWPDLCDQDGKRALLKADSGPGRMATGFLSWSYLEGLDFFPGLHNGTEATQECDQLFGAFKGSVYRNRETLYNARFEIDGYQAILTMTDMGHIIFGGEVVVSNDDVVCLEPAFDLYFSKEHIRASREKVGYWPATRAALDSGRVRHELVEGMDGSPDDTADPQGILLDALEKRNHDLVLCLEEKGYELASKAQ